MKKRITIDELAICFASAVVYGFGFLIPEYFGCSFILSIIISYVPGLPAEELAEKIIFSRFIQEHRHRRVFAGVVCIAIFVVGSIAAINIFGTDLNEDLGEEFIFALGVPLISFIIAFTSFTIKKRRLIKKHGDGSRGYRFSKDNKEYMRGLNGKNRPIVGRYKENLAVKTENGIFVGKKFKKVIAYLGIPYATPPVGALRWKKPVPLPLSEDVFEAYHYGASAVQPKNESNPLDNHQQSEDCLYLNIWKAKKSKPGTKHPVIVYLHDGDFLSGGSADPVGEGETFIKNNPEMIFVSFNYRLGLFGFVDFSRVKGGKDFSDAVNCGLLDQIEALKWIKKNISAFGGDPDNITLMGAGCGGTSALLLSTIDTVQECFRKVIVISASPEYVFMDPSSSAELGQTLMSKCGVKTMSDLINVPTKKLKDMMHETALIGGAPAYRTELLPEDILMRFKRNEIRDDLEIIIGLPKNEISNTIAVIGAEAARERFSQWFDEFGANSDGQEILETYQISKLDDTAKEDELYQKVNALIYIDIPMILGRILSANRHRVRFFLWDITPNVKKFQSNALSFLTTFLHNFDVGESFGYINDKNLKEVLQLLLTKYLKDEDVSLYPNEIIGIDAIKWSLYTREKPAVLRVNQKEIRIDTHFREDKDISKI